MTSPPYGSGGGSSSGSWAAADGLGPGGGRGVGILAQKSICVVIAGKAQSWRPDGPAMSLPEHMLRLCRPLPLFCALHVWGQVARSISDLQSAGRGGRLLQEAGQLGQRSQ